MDLPSKTEGAGNAGSWPPPWPASEKNAGGRYHRFSRDIPAFPTRWMERLLRVLPGAPGFLATVTCATRKRRRKLGISVGMPGPRDLTVRINVVRRRGQATLQHRHAHRIPPQRP
jgi:hypothetical protein